MATIFTHAVALVLAAALFTWIERRWAAQPDLRWWQRPLGMDLTYWFVGPVLGHLALFTGLIVIGLGLLAFLGAGFDRTLVERLQQGHPWVAGWPLWIQVVCAIIVADFTLYWIHRAFHRIPLLWPLHAVHHSAKRLDWLAAVRVHPLNTLISTTVLGTVLIVLGFPLHVLAGVVPFLGLLGLLGHANVTWEFGPWLRWVFASPRFHRWHHTQVDEGGDRNFAAFIPLWDRLFGTWYLPQQAMPERFGINGDPVPHQFAGQLLHPLRAWGGMVRARLGWGPSAPWGWGRWFAVSAGVLIVVVVLLGALLGPLATLAMQVSLPRDHGELHVSGYRRGGSAPQTQEVVRFQLPRESALGWFMAAVGHGLPPPAAEPGSVLWGEIRSPAVGAPMPIHVIARDSGSRPRLDLLLTSTRVNGWLSAGARGENSPWVISLDAGSRITEAGLQPPAGWDLALKVAASGVAARRDGQQGLVRIESLAGRMDLRWLPGQQDTRVDAQIHLERLRLSDPRSEQSGDVPMWVLTLVAQAINTGLRDQPPVLPLVVPREVQLSVEVIAPVADRAAAF
jgi:sterol desaturase/sphingolipid hydroxylase (fatty acid hydroxylase superfamily)